jgi:hypothetical protein
MIGSARNANSNTWPDVPRSWAIPSLLFQLEHLSRNPNLLVKAVSEHALVSPLLGISEIKSEYNMFTLSNPIAYLGELADELM